MGSYSALDLAPQELWERYGTVFPIDPQVLETAHLFAMPDDDTDARPDDVVQRYTQFMDEKRAAQKASPRTKPAAKASPALPALALYVHGDDDYSLEAEDASDLEEREERAAVAELTLLAIKESPTAGQDKQLQRTNMRARALGSAPPPAKALPVVVAAALATDLEHCRAPWDMIPRPLPADRFVAGRGREGVFPTGCMSTLAGPGGMGKTAVMIHLALCVAAGMPFMGLSTTEGCAILLSLEDGPEEMARRLGADASNFPPALHSRLMQRVQPLCIPGSEPGAFTARDIRGTISACGLIDRLIASAKALAERCGVPVKLIVVDHARLCAGGDLNDSEAASALTRALSRVAAETGAAVVLLAHSPKSSINTNRPDDFSAADVLGSGALVDNARCAAVMFGLVESERKKFGIRPEDAKSLWAFRVIKSNYSEAGRTYYMNKRHMQEWGVVVPEHVDLRPPTPAVRVNEDEQLDARVLAYVSARPGLLTKNKMLKEHVGTDGPLRAGKPALTLALSRMLATGRLAVREPTKAERGAGKLTALTKEVLYVPT